MEKKHVKNFNKTDKSKLNVKEVSCSLETKDFPLRVRVSRFNGSRNTFRIRFECDNRRVIATIGAFCRVIRAGKVFIDTGKEDQSSKGKGKLNKAAGNGTRRTGTRWACCLLCSLDPEELESLILKVVEGLPILSAAVRESCSCRLLRLPGRIDEVQATVIRALAFCSADSSFFKDADPVHLINRFVDVVCSKNRNSVPVFCDNGYVYFLKYKLPIENQDDGLIYVRDNKKKIRAISKDQLQFLF